VAAPVPASTRSAPTGFHMRDGYQTTIVLGADAAVKLWEKEVKPPAVDGGDPTDISTMHNVTWHTQAPRKLKKMDPLETVCAYEPSTYVDAMAWINIQETITIFFPDGSTLAFFGYLQKFDPQSLKEGEMPLANVTIIPTNTDSTGAEQNPVFTAGIGT